MQILLKRLFLIITTAIAISTIVLAVAEPQDEMRSLVIPPIIILLMYIKHPPLELLLA